MKKFILSLFLIGCMAVQAQTIQVSGIQTGVWDVDTVLVVGDMNVVDSLVVLPGTTVLFDGFYSIKVGKGVSFKALGTETDSIVFTVIDTTGFSVYNIGKGGWNGFQLNKSGKVLFDYCVLQYAKAADTLDRLGGALCIQDCGDVEVNHSILRCNFSREFGGAVYAKNSQVKFSDCNINENKVYTGDLTYAMYGGGAAFLGCDVEMRRMEFRDNYGPTCIGGALSLDSCSVVLDRSVFTNNIGINGGGMYLMRSNHKECRMSNLLFDDNYSGHFAGGFAVKNASPDVYNVLVINNRSEGVSCNGVFFFEESSPRLTNCIVYGNYPWDEGVVTDDSTQMWMWTFDGYGPEFYNCLIEGGLKYIHSPENIMAFENIIDANPMFVDAEHHDFHLQEGSPCRDAGAVETPSYITEGLDLGGLPRVANQRVDIGPYEYSGAAVSKQSSTPFAQLIGNPLRADSRIAFDEVVKEEVTVSIYDMTGRCDAVMVYHLDASRVLAIGSLVEHLSPGVYLIEVENKLGKCTLKAVK